MRERREREKSNKIDCIATYVSIPNIQGKSQYTKALSSRTKRDAAYSHASEARRDNVRQIAMLRVRRPSLWTVLLRYPTALVSLQ